MKVQFNRDLVYNHMTLNNHHARHADTRNLIQSYILYAAGFSFTIIIHLITRFLLPSPFCCFSSWSQQQQTAKEKGWTCRGKNTSWFFACINDLSALLRLRSRQFAPAHENYQQDKKASIETRIFLFAVNKKLLS